MARRPSPEDPLDAELADWPPALRWREWMGRVEAVIFAAPEPVGRAALARVVGRDCNLDRLLDDIRTELAGRPYELAAVAGGWQLRTRKAFAPAIRAATGQGAREAALSELEGLVLTAIAHLQPITRAELGAVFGRAVGRDTIGNLRGFGLIAAGPRSPRPGAPYTYVTTKAFLSHFGLDGLGDLPDREALQDAGLLRREPLAGDMPVARGDEDDEESEAVDPA